MTTDQETEIALTAIYTDALKLAAQRLQKIENEDNEDDVDRGARCARTLVITAKEVNALQSQIEKDDSADDAEAIAREVEDYKRYREKIMAIIERDEAGEGCAPEAECGPGEDGRRGDGQS